MIINNQILKIHANLFNAMILNKFKLTKTNIIKILLKNYIFNQNKLQQKALQQFYHKQQSMLTF